MAGVPTLETERLSWAGEAPMTSDPDRHQWRVTPITNLGITARPLSRTITVPLNDRGQKGTGRD